MPRRRTVKSVLRGEDEFGDKSWRGLRLSAQTIGTVILFVIVASGCLATVFTGTLFSGPYRDESNRYVAGAALFGALVAVVWPMIRRRR